MATTIGTLIDEMVTALAPLKKPSGPCDYIERFDGNFPELEREAGLKSTGIALFYAGTTYQYKDATGAIYDRTFGIQALIWSKSQQGAAARAQGYGSQEGVSYIEEQLAGIFAGTQYTSSATVGTESLPIRVRSSAPVILTDTLTLWGVDIEVPTNVANISA